MKAIWTLLGFIGRYRRLVPFLILLEVLAALAESFGLGLLVPFAQAVFGESGFGTLQGPLLGALAWFGALFGSERRPLLLGLSIIAFILAKTALWGGYIVATRWIKEKVVCSSRCTILERLLAADYAAFNAGKISEYHSVIASEAWRMSEGIGAFFQLIGRGAVVIVFTLILLILSWKLFVFSILAFVGSSLLIRSLSHGAKSDAERGMEADMTLSSRLLAVLSGMRTVRLFRQEQAELGRFTREAQRSRHSYFRYGVTSALVGPVLETLYIPFFVVMVFLAHRAGMPMAQLLAFLVLMYRMVPHVRAAEEARVLLAGSMGAVNATVGLLKTFAHKPEAGTAGIDAFTDRIVFDRVGFSYSAGRAGGFAVSDISFTIPRGGTVALVGASGSGKSTLVNLLLGLYVPDDGKIVVDGRPLRALDPLSWRRRIGFAGQDSQLFAGTIAENIAYGCPDALRSAVEDVARRTDVLEFTDRLPQRLDTPIARDGLDLSGGQRQRIALARALLGDPDILLLDEATNALDNVTEAAIQRTLAEIGRRKTTIIVAHRMSTIRHADWIIALDHGRIAEQGSPAELLRRNAAFARLYKLEAEIAFSGAAPAE